MKNKALNNIDTLGLTELTEVEHHEVHGGIGFLAAAGAGFLAIGAAAAAGTAIYGAGKAAGEFAYHVIND
ncbi:hypothetical protein H8S90_09205 [Olivibacter sp. SDN3]|uniref:hypothetical protein n=1 Tax=Olivibacter sp. SDN3 TaxID=2764720 RepID=UPI0016511598|nr:hypothetical protein [Olivibacter sp. SDN3]QNL51729.1 hypothetical protein H8S90_09205 [Olivibacter sp. SDN3]